MLATATEDNRLATGYYASLILILTNAVIGVMFGRDIAGLMA